MTLEIALRLQKLRKEKGYSQEELADKLGVSRQAVSKWERAEASPDTDNLILLSRLYGVSVDELLNSSESTEEIKEEQAQPTKCESSADDFADEKAEAESSAELLKLADSRRRKRVARGIIDSTVVFLSVVVYILLGALGGWWHPAWIVFLAIPIFCSLGEAVLNRNAENFAYPVLVTAIYLCLGCVYGLWHPWWVVFVTIPVYYAIVNIAKNRR